MIKRVFLYCLLLFLPLVAYPDAAPSQKLENLDVNKDSEQALYYFKQDSFERFRLMDANGDGQITEEEFLISAADRFKKMDLNSDGLLKKRELRRIVNEARKKSKMDGQKIKKEPKPFIKQ